METILTRYRRELDASRLFSGLNDRDRLAALSFFDAAAAEYPKGKYLHRSGEPLPRFGLVLEGLVQALNDDINGNRMIMANVTPGGTFGEALCFLKEKEPGVYICAARPSVILWLSSENVLRRERSDFEAEMKNRFTAMLAERTLSMNDRIQILSKLTLREKIIALFSTFAHRDERTFTLPFDRNDMADYLGANRSALSRELSRMKAEGIIDYRKNRFTLL